MKEPRKSGLRYRIEKGIEELRANEPKLEAVANLCLDFGIERNLRETTKPLRKIFTILGINLTLTDRHLLRKQALYVHQWVITAVLNRQNDLSRSFNAKLGGIQRAEMETREKEDLIEKARDDPAHFLRALRHSGKKPIWRSVYGGESVKTERYEDTNGGQGSNT